LAILKVAQMGHPVLRRVADPIDPEHILSPGVQGLIQDMLDTVNEYDGLGLAAPQVHYSVRLVLLTIGEELRVIINPVITPLTEETRRTYEGCLSVEGMRAAVERCARVRLEAWDEQAQRVDEVLEDMDAVVVQHECDHLDGVLYIDRCDTTTLAFLPEYRRYGPLDEFFADAEGEDGEEGEE
jgi:peptide deformylase